MTLLGEGAMQTDAQSSLELFGNVEPLWRTAARQQGSRYIMQGSETKRALDKYHLIFAPTHACNLRCGHCYLHDHESDLLPQEVALRLVDQWADLVSNERGPFGGIFHVKGGEPFVVPYIGNLFDRVVKSGSLELMITTNGTILSAKSRAALTKASTLGSRFTIIVSIDGSTEQTHDFLRGSGSFALSMEFLKYVAELGVTIHFNSVLYRENLHQISDIVQLARTFGAAQVNFLPFVSKGFGEHLKHAQIPHVKAFEALQEFYEGSTPDVRKMLIGSAPDLLRREKDGLARLSHECVAAYRGLFYIKPDGSAYTCPNIESPRYSIGNVKTSSLLDLSDRLGELYAKLRTSRGDDSLLCVGEALLYDFRKDLSNVASLKEMQTRTAALRKMSRDDSQTEVLAYCVSRNF
jgi:MoaA/NifB/PqqE/SkfB family radical SAM enzyme